MKLAAIDIGSNSIHLVVAHIHADGTWTLVDRAKDMVGLASRTLADGYLSQKALDLGLATLHTFKRMSDAHGVDAIVAVATSAVREANNGNHFVELVRRECEIDVEVIPGEEEARLIYLGCRRHVDWGDRRALIIDIGGGSVEFIVGDEHQADFYASLPLGVRRISERFLSSDPYTKPELKALRKHIEEQLGEITETLREHEFDFVVGSSGTLNNLAIMVAEREGRPTGGSHGLWVNLSSIAPMARELSGMTSAKRARYPGLDPKRTDNIVAGAQLIKYIMRAVGHETYFACDYALREGLVVDWIDDHSQGVPASIDEGDIRRRSVLTLLRRFNIWGAHPTQVAQLSLSLFDQLREPLGLDASTRDLLEYGALLHDLGYAIHARGHHKHSFYLIRHGDLHGFDQREILLIALIARYHRRSFPREHHEGYSDLPEADRKIVWQLAAILRLGNALDRSRTNNISDVTATANDKELQLELKPRTDASLELWALRENSELFEQTFGRKVVAKALPIETPNIHWLI